MVELVISTFQRPGCDEERWEKKNRMRGKGKGVWSEKFKISGFSEISIDTNYIRYECKYAIC